MMASVHTGPRLLNSWRVIGWGGAAALLTVPAILGWPWPVFAFAAFGLMFAIVGLLIEVAAHKARTPAHAVAAAIALVTAFVLQWIARVGASDGRLENFVYLVVALMALAGAVGARFRAEGLAWAMFLAGGFQLLIAAAGFADGWAFTEARGPADELAFNVGLALPWLLSGALFRANAPSRA